MELTDPSDLENLDSAAFALHSMHLAICTAAFAFNFFLLYLLTKCSAFHTHMKIILIHQTMGVMAADLYLLVRSTLGLWQTYNGSPKEPLEMVDYSQCAFSASVPDSICTLFIWFPLLLVTERVYASKNYQDYENSEAPTLFRILCGIMWMPVISEMILFVLNLSVPSNLHACQYSLLQLSHMQRNVWFIIIAAFSIFFSVLFKILEFNNKTTEKNAVANDYVFSCRYQIRENIRTCRFAFSLLLLFFIFFFIFYLLDRNLETSEDARMTSATRREYLFLIFPVFSLVYSFHFLTANASLFETAKRTIQQYYNYESGSLLF